MDQVSKDVNALMRAERTPIGFMIDESSHVKKGDKSVGVARQYCGTAGNVENCQVAVYGAFTTRKYCRPADCEHFCPVLGRATKSVAKKAGVPDAMIVAKSMPEIAIELIERQVASGNRIDFVVGDGLYGNNYPLLDRLDELGPVGVLDVHKDQHVYLEQPVMAVPERKGAKGHRPETPKAGNKPIKAEDLKAQLEKEGKGFEEIEIRQGTKGPVKSKVALVAVYTWDKKSAAAKKEEVAHPGIKDRIGEGGREVRFDERGRKTVRQKGNSGHAGPAVFR